MNEDEKSSKQVAFGVLVTAILGLFSLVYPLRNLSYDLLFLGRSEKPVDEVVIVYLDDDSLEALGSPDRLSIDRVNRKVHAELIRKLSLSGVRLIAFDVLFEEPTTPDEDMSLVAAARDHGGVLVGVKLQKGENSGADITTRKLPFPRLREVVDYGLVEGSWSGRSCRTLMVPLEGIESLAWKAAEKRKANRLRDPTRTRWMNYYGPPGHVSHLSFVQVLSNEIPANITLNQRTTVFVGANTTAGGLRGRGMDIFDTPYTLWSRKPSSGTEVCATAYLNLMQGDWLEELSLPVELLLILLFGGFSTWILARLRPWQAFGAAVALGVTLTLTAHFLGWMAHFWFPWVGMAGIQLPLALTWSVLSHSGRLSEQMRALERRLRQRARRRKRDKPTPEPAGASDLPLSDPEISHVPVPSIPGYELLRLIGKGGFGHVWLARNPPPEKCLCAVKVVWKSPNLEGHQFAKEFKGIQKFTPVSLEHPGLVQILHVGQPADGRYFYYVMEPADDLELGQKISPTNYLPKTLLAELSRCKCLSTESCIELGLALCSALSFLHQRDLIHRDIKPANIIFVNAAPKLADIGLVTNVPRPGEDVSFVGTQGYFPPEGPGKLGDIYSMGQVLADAYWGLRRPRRDGDVAMPPRQSGGAAAQVLAQLICLACDADSAKRHQSAAELHSALLKLDRTVT